MGINVKANARLNINGKMTPVADVAIGQELTTYVHVTDPGIALASDVEVVEFTPVAATPEPAPEPEPAAQVAAAPEMPKTATWLPLAGTLGIILLALGAGISFLCRRGQA